MTVDYLIQGALVCDGTGSQPEKKDIAIAEDRIVAISGGEHGIEASETIDASGLVASPGFIDVHTHDDFSVLMTPDMEYKIRQGVTTSIAGNCGFSVSPYHDALQQTIFYHDLSRIPVWDTFSSYMKLFNERPATVNVGVLAGLGAIRYAVARDSKAPLDRAEIQAQRSLIEQALGEGVLGLSLGLAYFPGRYSSTEELIDTIGVMKGYSSLFAIHMRDEGHNLISALEETLAISHATGVPAHVSHFKALGRNNLHLFGTALDLIDKALNEGIPVTADLYPYDSGSTALKEVLQWNILSPDRGSPMFEAEPSEIVIVSSESHPEWIGRNIGELADELSLSPDETARKIVDTEENILIAMRNCISESNIDTLLGKPYSMIGSDGIPTKTGFSNPRLYGTFPRVIGRYSRDRKVLSLQDAIYKMTGFPASRFGLKNRGVIREGAAADIVIFDYSKIRDLADYSNPRQYPVGIKDIFVNGVRTMENGALTGKRSGRALIKE